MGQLHLLGAALSKRRALNGDVAVIQLVRDPRAMIASQARLNWWNRSLPHEIARVSERQCEGMLADAATGAALKQQGLVRHVLVRFEQLVADLPAVVGQVYSATGWEVPRTTREWLERTLSGQCDTSSNWPSANAFAYSTCRINETSARRRAGWREAYKRTLTRRERRTIERKCAGALHEFGYWKRRGQERA